MMGFCDIFDFESSVVDICGVILLFFASDVIEV
jgi:hypothetical protein